MDDIRPERRQNLWSKIRRGNMQQIDQIITATHQSHKSAEALQNPEFFPSFDIHNVRIKIEGRVRQTVIRRNRQWTIPLSSSLNLMV